MAARAPIAIIASEFNAPIVNALLQQVERALQAHGYNSLEYTIFRVPGAFEIPIASLRCAQTKRYSAILALGVLIQGDTAHFEYISESVAHGLMQVSLNCNLPVIYGILNAYTEEQAWARAASHGLNKGKEVAEATLSILNTLHLVDTPRT